LVVIIILAGGWWVWNSVPRDKEFKPSPLCPPKLGSSEPGLVGPPNPSAVYCTSLGYKNSIKTLEDSGQISYCVFEDFIFGKKGCPSWDFLPGNADRNLHIAKSIVEVKLMR